MVHIAEFATDVLRYIANLRQELRPMLRLAAPLVTAELGWMGMGVVDTMMVGRVSAEAMGAVSLDEINITRLKSGIGQCFADDSYLRGAIWSGQPTAMAVLI